MIPASESAALALRPAPIFLEGKLPVLEASTARHLGLQDGQVVQANAEVQNGQWRLRFMAGGEIPLTKDWPAQWRLAAGDSVLFRVQLMANGTIVLRPIPASPPALPSSPAAESEASPEVMATPLSHLLARPSDGSSLMALLTPGHLEAMTRHLGEMPGPLAEWLKNRPSMRLLNADQLKIWLLQSGWFNEALLFQGKAPAGADLKTALRSLLKSMQLGQDPGAKEVQSALDDLESSQLSTVIAAQHGEAAPAVMLAFRDAPPVKMQIRRSAKEHDGERALQIDLEINHVELGPIWLRTRILGSDQLDMVMWAERMDVVEMARAHTDRLQEQLQSAGLNMLSLQVFQGQAPHALTTTVVDREPGQLLDIRT